MLSKVSVKSWQRNAIKNFSQISTSKFQSKVDTESFSQKLTAKCNAKFVREVALRYRKQINHGRYQWQLYVTRFPLYLRQKIIGLKEEGISQRTIHRRIQLDDAVKNVIDYFKLVYLTDGCIIINEKIKGYTRRGSFSLTALLFRGFISKCQNYYFPSRTWSLVSRDPNCFKNKTKATRSEAIDCADGSVPRQSDLYIRVPVFVAHVPLWCYCVWLPVTTR